MSARVIEVADAVAARLTATVPSNVATVIREYVPLLGAGPGGRWPTGRRVYVFPDGYAQVGVADRASDLNEYRVGLVVAERHPAAPALPPTAWVDDLTGWVEESVYGLLQDVRGEYLLGTLWPETAEVVEVYDPDLLREHGGFVSEIRLAFREIR